jgi:tetratricopeptide (TPR) repeat protein
MINLLLKSYRVLFFDELEDYKKAIADLTAYLATHPGNGIAYNNRGLAFSEIGRGEEALADFAMAIACSPHDPLPLINRGDLYERYQPEGKLDEAIADYDRATFVSNDEPTFHRCKAYACLKAKRFPEAVESFSAAIRIDPGFRQTYLDRAKAYTEIGEMDKAKKDIDQAGRLTK